MEEVTTEVHHHHVVEGTEDTEEEEAATTTLLLVVADMEILTVVHHLTEVHQEVTVDQIERIGEEERDLQWVEVHQWEVLHLEDSPDPLLQWVEGMEVDHPLQWEGDTMIDLQEEVVTILLQERDMEILTTTLLQLPAEDQIIRDDGSQFLNLSKAKTSSLLF